MAMRTFLQLQVLELLVHSVLYAARAEAALAAVKDVTMRLSFWCHRCRC